MKRAFSLLIRINTIAYSSFSIQAQAKEIKYHKDAKFEYFDVDLTGYELYSFGDFNQLGYKITPLVQLFLAIIQTEREWIDEPRLYIRGKKGFFHLWKEDGTNVLYTVKEDAEYWKIVDVKRKKLTEYQCQKNS